jgi:hypothetical protein
MMFLLAITLASAVVLGIYIVVNALAGPDPDLEAPWDPRDSFFGRQRCVCGRWRDEVNHVHPGWSERKPR